MKKTNQKPKGGYESPLLNFRATNTVIERKTRKVFASRYLHRCEFLFDRFGILVLEQIAKAAGLGDRVISLWLGGILDRPTIHYGRYVGVLMKSLCDLKILAIKPRSLCLTSSFLHGLSMTLPQDILTTFSLTETRTDDRALVRTLQVQRALQNFSLNQVNVRGSFTGVYAVAIGLTELRSFDIIFVWVSNKALHFTDKDWPLLKSYSDSTMRLGELQAKLRATSHEEMVDALRKVQLITPYANWKRCRLGVCSLRTSGQDWSGSLKLPLMNEAA